jgi:hypothetical protein
MNAPRGPSQTLQYAKEGQYATIKKPKSRSSRASRTSKRTSTAAAEEGSDEESKDTKPALWLLLGTLRRGRWRGISATVKTVVVKHVV